MKSVKSYLTISSVLPTGLLANWMYAGRRRLRRKLRETRNFMTKPKRRNCLTRPMTLWGKGTDYEKQASCHNPKGIQDHSRAG